MKRLTALLIICFIVLTCSFGVGETENPILGGWYIFMNTADLPSDPSLDTIAHAIIIVTFEENGNITSGEIDYCKDGTIETREPTSIGKWNKDGSDYVSSIVAIGKDKMFFENDLLYVMLFNNSTYVGLRKMDPFDPYTNIYIKSKQE